MQIATAIYHTLYTNTETYPMRIGKAKAKSLFYNKAKNFDNKANTFAPITRRTIFHLLLRIG
jgi:hypothetical protein